ncbi:hypothetical protein [Pseudorhodoplanes sinuspersici]|uniref:hypothetical protein n=1 Tax=Pseudorhodoplanes sinuspersici TaxID=1235591 RepID=UPI0011C48832|nr:hypothetical protein [Pseudorhodoplanes sinuspersici]
MLALNPELSIGEAYMDGLLAVEEGTLFDFLEIAARNYGNSEQVAWFSLLSRATRRGFTRDRHVAHHYDLSGPVGADFDPAHLMRTPGHPQMR